MFDASVSNGQLIWALDKSSVAEILKKGEILTAMATIMYSQNSLQQVRQWPIGRPVIEIHC